MLRIKLFGLFIAFALLALVRPRKVMELLEAADNWAEMARLNAAARARVDAAIARGTKLTEKRVPL